MAEEKKIVRLADVGELENILRKDLAEEEAKGKDADTLFCEDVAGELTDLESLPTIDLKNLQPVWRDPETDPPKVETEVLVLVDCGKGYCITTAFYEDGTVSQYESLWQWDDVDDYGIYDEEEGLYRLQNGWWEYRHFTPDDALECPIDKPVVGWMPLPEKLKKEGVA